MDLAASIQAVTEEIMLRCGAPRARARRACARSPSRAASALNCVGNGKLLREGPFDDVWIQPAAGDAGGALGVGALRLAPAARPAARRCIRGDGQAGLAARTGLLRRRDPGLPRRHRRAVRAGDRHGRALRRGRRLPRARRGHRLVPGTHGVRTARARLSLHPGRRPRSRACSRASTSRSSSASGSGRSRPRCWRSTAPSTSRTTVRAPT